MATDGETNAHPALSEALGCPRDGWGGCRHQYKLIIRRTRKVRLARPAARALSLLAELGPVRPRAAPWVGGGPSWLACGEL